MHLAQDFLQAAVINIYKVVEHEHQILDAGSERRIYVGDVLHHAGFDRRFQCVDDIGSRLFPTELGGAAGSAGKALFNDLIELRERSRLHAIQGRDAHHHICMQVGRQLAHDIGRHVRFKVRQDDGDDLRVLVMDDFGDTARVHPLQGLQTLVGQAHIDAFDDICGLLLAQCVGHHIAQEFIDADTHRGLAAYAIGKGRQDTADFFTRYILQLGHGSSDFLHFTGTHVLEHLGRLRAHLR